MKMLKMLIPAVAIIFIITSNAYAWSKLNNELVIAVLLGNTKRVEELLPVGANPNTIAAMGRPVLVYALMGESKITKLLLDKGANVNAKDKDGSTALMYAMKNAHVQIIKLLKAHGAQE